MADNATFDALVIGTGQAGPPLAERLSRAGMSVAVVERGRFGGTCVNTGCTPTKTMVASAYAAHLARRAGQYGVNIAGGVAVDMAAVKARKDAVVEKSRSGVEKWMRGLERCTVVTGHARFVGPRRVAVGGSVLEAGQVFIDVGARPLVPDMPGLDGVAHLTSSTVMDLDEVPPHLVIVGGSYVGLEFGQMFARFGSRVTLVEMGERLIGREDPEISDAVRQFLEGEDIEVWTRAKCLEVLPADRGFTMGVQCDYAMPGVWGTHLLLAVGRRPNTDDLGLDAAGVEVDERGYIRVDEALRTSAEGVYALGDCNGRGAFTHTAYNDHEIVASNLLDGGSRKVTDRVPVYALFTDPPLGRVGLTEAEAVKKGHRVRAASMPMAKVSRAIEKGETTGLMKVVVDASDERILGAAILGVGGDEVVHSLVDAVAGGVPYGKVRDAVRIHPTVSELIPTLLGRLPSAPV